MSLGEGGNAAFTRPFASLEGEVVLITGARQGIGAGVRDAFVAVGARVVGAARAL
ncbi:MAG: hypothetical protein L0J79_08285 [Propionibacterium sp.]|nr:hypothetical protein [Propionibacterium sp.]